MRWRFLDGGLPAPRLQVALLDAGRTHHLDMGWEEHLVGVEFDGLDAHMTREQLAADRDRHNWVTERRWTLLHFTAVDVYRRHVAMVERTARALGLPCRRRSRACGRKTPNSTGAAAPGLHDRREMRRQNEVRQSRARSSVT